MSVSPEQVRHIAKLARIAMSDEELDRLLPELNNILGWVEQLGDSLRDQLAHSITFGTPKNPCWGSGAFARTSSRMSPSVTA